MKHTLTSNVNKWRTVWPVIERTLYVWLYITGNGGDGETENEGAGGHGDGEVGEDEVIGSVKGVRTSPSART